MKTISVVLGALGLIPANMAAQQREQIATDTTAASTRSATQPTLTLEQETRLVAPPLASASSPLVFRGVTVIDVREGRRLPNRTVVIVGHRIQRVAPVGQGRLPAGARVVDARGKFLIPGLWDMHAHPRGYEDVAYPLFIANGVTGVRDAGSYTPLATLTQWKKEIAAGNRVGPRLIVAGPRVNEARDTQTTVTISGGLGDALRVPRAALGRVVDSLKAAGADFLKTYFFSREGYFAVAAEARRAGIPFGGHLPDEVTPLEASDSGAVWLDHLVHPCWGHHDSLRGASCTAAVQRFRQNGSWGVAAPAVLDSLAGQSRAAYRARVQIRAVRYWHGLRPQWRDDVLKNAKELLTMSIREPTATEDWASNWARRNPDRRKRLARLRADSVPLLVGSDLGVTIRTDLLVPGFSTPEQLVGLVVLGGFTPLEALQTATLNPARALRATDSLGTAEAGKMADLVLLDTDPLADIWHTTMIRAVVANGRYFDRPALDRLLADVQEKVQND